MEIKFIGQGLDPDSDITAGNFIIDSLESKKYSSFNAFVAFVSTSGLKNIIDQMLAFKQTGGEIKLYVGVNLNATSKEALEKLLEHKIESYVIYSPNNIIYHTKLYAFESNVTTRTIIGSSNLTESGLFQNIEASVCVDFESDDKNGHEFLSNIYDHFNTIINQEHPSCQLLTQEVLEVLIESNVVLPEATSRAKSNKINKEFGQQEIKANKRLLELFGKVKAKRPPKGFKKSATQKEYIKQDNSNDVNIVEENIFLNSGSMWIQTGVMTSAARNIVGLSKKGRLPNRNSISGSVSFFGINPDTDTHPIQIDVEYAGDLYKGNQVHYTTNNGSWRLNFYGETDSGNKFTDITRPKLGTLGAFQNKILLFTRLTPTQYKLEVLDDNEVEKLKDLSSLWAENGTSPLSFGYIA
ncbi:phospholipase D-like domain-containing protein [Pedobacter sp.]|uniref:phospholipase D-like domain-containing protein n=1 Tax=Pedobacter sp. TaxID=1411316 RepID=UPI003D7FB4D1